VKGIDIQIRQLGRMALSGRVAIKQKMKSNKKYGEQWFRAG
jgi:hypothetical protein